MDQSTFKMMMAASIKGGAYWIGTISDPTNTHDQSQILNSSQNSSGQIAFAFSPRNISANRRRAGYFFIDESGSITFQNLETQTNNSRFETIDFDELDNLYLCGERQTSISGESAQTYLVKYNELNIKQWERTINNQGFFDSRGRGAKRHSNDNAGNSYIVYAAFSGEDINIRYYFTKIDTSGNFVWARNRDFGVNTFNNDLCSYVSPSQNILFNIPNSQGGQEGVVNYDTNGNIIFAREVNSKLAGSTDLESGGQVITSGMAFDSLENRYEVGRFFSDTFQAPGFPSGFRLGYCTVRKFSPNSQGVLWQFRLGFAVPDNTVSPRANPRDEFARAAIAFDDTDNSFYICGSSNYDGLGLKGIIAKIDSNGNLLFQKQLSSPSVQIAFNSIEIDSNGDLVLGGRFGSFGLVAKLPPDGSGDGSYGDFVYGDSTLAYNTSVFAFGQYQDPNTLTLALTTRTDTSVTPSFSTDITNL
jgi:hypothetical protein